MPDEGLRATGGEAGPDARALIEKKLRLLMTLRRAGIGDTRVLRAIEKTPREKFVPAAFEDRAYENVALPIGQGQTVSQPYVVALMTEKLEVGQRHNVLEIGTGSGYQTAILARLGRRVFTVERHRELLRDAEHRFGELRLRNIVCRIGDGSKGWPAQAPYDRVIVPQPRRKFRHPLSTTSRRAASSWRQSAGTVAISSSFASAAKMTGFPPRILVRSGLSRWSSGCRGAATGRLDRSRSQRTK